MGRSQLFYTKVPGGLATGVDPGSCFSFECYHCDAIDVSGILCPVVT